MQTLDNFWRAVTDIGRDTEYLRELRERCSLRSAMTDAGAQENLGHALDLGNQWVAQRDDLVERMFGDFWLSSTGNPLAQFEDALPDEEKRDATFAAVFTMLSTAYANMGDAIGRLDDWCGEMRAVHDAFVADNEVYAQWLPDALLSRLIALQDTVIALSGAGAQMAIDGTPQSWRALRSRVRTCIGATSPPPGASDEKVRTWKVLSWRQLSNELKILDDLGRADVASIPDLVRVTSHGLPRLPHTFPAAG